MSSTEKCVFNGKTYTLECYRKEITMFPSDDDVYYCITDEEGRVIANEKSKSASIQKALAQIT